MTRPGKQQLILLVDALGWLTAERTGFLGDLLPHRRKLRTIFGFSSTAIPTLLTGALPSRHGHWFLFRRATGERPFREAGWLDKLPGRIANRWRVRVRVQEYWRRKNRIKGYFSIYNVPWRVLSEMAPVEQDDTWGLGSFPGTPTLIDWLHERGEPYHVSDWRIPDARKIETALRVIREDAPRTVVLYLTEVDATQHRVGSVHREFDRHLETLQTQVHSVVEAMRAQGDLGISLFSDHGMTDITGTGDLGAALVEADLVRHRDYDGFIDSTVARFWNVKDPARLRAALDAVPWGHVVDDATLESWGSSFPAGEYGDLFFLADPGTLILPSDMGGEPLAGMHGFTPDHPTSDACFLSDREVPLESDHLVSVLPAMKRRITEGW